MNQLSKAKVSAPETYYLPPTKYVPNSRLAVLIYRDVLPRPITEQSCQEFVERNGWDRKGQVWGPVYRRHFHPNSHECYGVMRGSSVVLMGVGTSDVTEGRTPDDKTSDALGLRLTLKEGDIIVHPAGTSHSNFSAEGDYVYLAFFPRGAPRWRTENGTVPFDEAAIEAEIAGVEIPEDPVLGGEGYLQEIWARGE